MEELNPLLLAIYHCEFNGLDRANEDWERTGETRIYPHAVPQAFLRLWLAELSPHDFWRILALAQRAKVIESSESRMVILQPESRFILPDGRGIAVYELDSDYVIGWCGKVVAGKSEMIAYRGGAPWPREMPHYGLTDKGLALLESLNQYQPATSFKKALRDAIRKAANQNRIKSKKPGKNRLYHVGDVEGLWPNPLA